MFNLSVCLIVKNEQDVIARCLDCVKQFADEIIIVDTGSNDNTKNIAKCYTPNIYDFKWVDDFSKARNYAFSLSKCDYVMWVDADDVIDEDNIKKLNNLKNQKDNADCYLLKYNIEFNNKAQPTFSYYRERIFNKKLNFIWVGFVHEVIAPKGKIEYLDIEINHKKIKSGNPKRNLNLYKKYLKNGNKLNNREQYYYSKELFYNNYFCKALKELKKYLKMKNNFLPNVIDSYLTIARIYFSQKKIELAKNIILKMFNSYTPISEVCCLMGDCFISQSNNYSAIFWFESAIVCPSLIDLGCFEQKEFKNIIPYLQLTYLYYQIGKYDIAKKYHLLAKEIDENNISVIYNNQYFN